MASVADLNAAIIALQTTLTAGGAGVVDPIAELGITLEEKQYASRLLALTNPGTYATNRAAAFTTMKTAVTASYNGAYASFITAGYPSDQAKRSALAAAENTRRVERLIVEQNFPSSANAIGNASAIRTAAPGAFGGSLGMAAPRPMARRSAAAPRRRKAKARKKK
jgi:hypothetical protein